MEKLPNKASKLTIVQSPPREQRRMQRDKSRERKGAAGQKWHDNTPPDAA